MENRSLMKIFMGLITLSMIAYIIIINPEELVVINPEKTDRNGVNLSTHTTTIEILAPPPDPYDNHCHSNIDTKQATHPLSAKEVIKIVSDKLGDSKVTSRDIYSAFESNMISINRSDANNIKIILGYHGYIYPLQNSLNFTECEYSNCVGVNPHRTEKPGFVQPKPPYSLTRAAHIILFNLAWMNGGKTLNSIPRRLDQYFGISSIESPSFKFNIMPSLLDSWMNFSTTYSDLSTIPSWHMYKGCQYRRAVPLDPINYADGKSKGALVYINHCDSTNYSRLNMIKALSKYIDVELYGRCGKPNICTNSENPTECEYTEHKKYYFYLSFENSLCRDYITEKFWKNLADRANMVPVAMGGLVVQEYTDLAPSNSFIHALNFSSVEELGRYLKYLMNHPDEYNAYHQWRETWWLSTVKYVHGLPACELCRIANEKPHMPAIKQLSSQYNYKELCENYMEFPSNSIHSGQWNV